MRTLVMGILNVTPDSFSDGGRFEHDPERAIEAGLALIAEGADIIDVGGESTRPGASPVDEDEERRRVLPVIRGLARQAGDVPISIDTYKAGVARAAIDEGALMINDISGLKYEPEIARVAADSEVALVLMHTRGRFTDMYAHAAYHDVVREVAGELGHSLQQALDAGVLRDAIVLDPGIGFAKRAEESFATLAGLDDAAMRALDRPLLVGPSRKSFLLAATGGAVADRGPTAPERVWGTAAAVTAAVLAGAHVIRVHDVKEMVQVVRVADKIRTLSGEHSPR